MTSLAFSPDGKVLASGSVDQTIKLWDVATGKEKATLKGHTDRVSSVAYSPNGKMLASGSDDQTIKIWDVGTGKEQATLMGHTDPVSCLSYSPDGKTVASGSVDKTIKLWDVATRKKRATLNGHKEAVMAVAYSPDIALRQAKQKMQEGKPIPEAAEAIETVDVPLPSFMKGFPLAVAPADDQLQRLLKERASTAASELAARYINLVLGYGSLILTFTCAERLLIARLELSGQIAEQIRVGQQYLEFARLLEAHEKSHMEGGKVPKMDFDHAHYVRLDAEIALLEAKQMMPKGKGR